MDSSPPITPLLKSQPRLRPRPVPRLTVPFDDPTDSPDLTSPSPKNPSPPVHRTIHELLLLPPSPYRRPKTRHFAGGSLDPPPAETTPRRRGKTRLVAGGGGSGISPRNGRRARRRLDKEVLREERELGLVEEEDGKVKKRRPSRPRPARKEKLSLLPLLPPSPQIKQECIHQECPSSLDGLSMAITDLVMWQNVAKSALWFGLGSILFLSSILSRDVGFSVISAVSHLGILILCLAFFYDSVKQRKREKKKGLLLQLTENDVLRAARVILPVINAALVKSQQIFSGEPLMTLRVAPVLLFMAKYGYMITLWRLLAIGFFLSFTAPKLYYCYYQQIQKKVDDSRNYANESWRSCSRKKLIAITSATVMWNILSIKMRIFAGTLNYLH
ncbi:Reticulon-like protein B18 [Apostasia shenzhenica]|uniref:Reticulon-like protein n=1 Tax=Apostasia shenzhenica TaxID=1088818 RepID=A0A2I0ATH9_9ASPA|nr:Reticulon-like protein B18 [Apostasia shenzhenica]